MDRDKVAFDSISEREDSVHNNVEPRLEEFVTHLDNIEAQTAGKETVKGYKVKVQCKPFARKKKSRK